MASEQPSAGAYPQAINPNVIQAQPTGSSILSASALVSGTASGTYNLIPGAGAGNSIYLNTIAITAASLGGSLTALGYINVQDGAGNVIYPNIWYNLLETTLSFNGYQVGNNRRLDVAVQVPSGTTLNEFAVAATYSLGLITT
jgi:hypothetical protein